jgi:hypothetical protein
MVGGARGKERKSHGKDTARKGWFTLLSRWKEGQRAGNVRSGTKAERLISKLRISICGDQYLRRLAVSAAQHILGPFGGRQRAARARTTSRPGGRTAKAKKRARGRRVKARRIASYALEIREPYEFFPTMA